MYIDAHAHLDKLGESLGPALVEIESHRIFTISVSMDLPSFTRNLEIAEQCDLVLATFGIHPWMAPEYADRLPELDEPIRRSAMVGEIGLDYHWVEQASHHRDQRKVFEYCLGKAGEQDKIVNLHTKGAEREILELLDKYDVKQAIIHWYSGPLNVLEEMVDKGYYFSIGVEVLYSDDIKRIAREVPLDLMLTETDNPGGIDWLTGERGMPRHVIDVVKMLAEIRGMTFEDAKREIYENFLRLLGGNKHVTSQKVSIS